MRASRASGNRIVALVSALLIAGLLVGLTSASAGVGGPTASAAKCKKNKKGKCIKKKKKKKKPVPAIPPAVMSVSPANFSYPNASNGGECNDVPDPDCPDQVFTVTNTGGSASGVPSASIAMTSNGNVPVPDNRAGFKILPDTNTCTAALAPGASCSLTVTFTPESEGTFAGTLNVTTSPGTAGSASLSGTGV
jgi:hypothetical protein